MFNFFDEIKSKCKCAKDAIFPYKIIQLGNQIVHFVGNNKLMTFTSTEIVFKTNNDIIMVVGDNLYIKDIQQDCLTIMGKIQKIERV